MKHWWEQRLVNKAVIAIAHAIEDSDTEIITHVPGLGGTEVFETINQTRKNNLLPSFHEEVAYTIAHSASLVGQRSVSLIKTHGIAKAANSVTDSIYIGNKAGFLIFVFDDKRGLHSDSILDAKKLLKGLRIPFVIPEYRNIYEEIKQGFIKSEEIQLPYAFIIDTDELNQTVSYTRHKDKFEKKDFLRNAAKYIMSPFTSKYQAKILNFKLNNNKMWQNLAEPQMPKIPESLPAVLQEALEPYFPFFECFRRLRGSIVTGDAGSSALFAFSPYNCIDICTYMGGSIPLAIGCYLAGYKDVWGITGDFSFISAGQLGLIEALQRNLPIKIAILDNGKAQATGGQAISENIIDTILKGYKNYLRHIRNTNEIEKAIIEANNSKEMQILLIKCKW